MKIVLTGQKCKAGDTNYETTLEISCNQNGTSGAISFDQASLALFDINSCTNTIKATSYNSN